MREYLLLISIALPIATFVGYLGFLVLLQVILHRHALKAVRTIARNPDQITPEAFRVRCEPMLEDRLREIQRTAPRVRRLRLDMTVVTRDGGWVPKSLPTPRLWVDPNYDMGPADPETSRAQSVLNEDAEFLRRLVGGMRPEQLTLASIVSGSRPLVVEAGESENGSVRIESGPER